MLKKSIFLFIVLVSIFGFGNVCFSQEYPSVPETLEEVRGVGEQAIKRTPESFKEAGGEAVSIWKKLWGIIKSWTRFFWDRIYLFLNTEVEKRKPEVRQSFEREVEELKQEVKREAPSVWQRFKELIGR